MDLNEFDKWLPAWLQSDRRPLIETRPENAGDEWPKGTTERVTFTREEYPGFPCQKELPATVYLGADGWPTTAPEALKPDMNPDMKAVFRRSPYALMLETCVRSWRRTCCQTYEEWAWDEQLSSFANEALGLLPGPSEDDIQDP